MSTTPPTHAPRENWSSRLGFILATSGAAIGLGNIQRFPYIAAENGGGAFLFVYLLSAAILGIPLILNEFAIGRFAKLTPFGAIQKIHPKGPWKYVGLFSILVAFFILSYYLVVAGWTLGFTTLLLADHQPELSSFASNPMYFLPCMIVFLLGTIYVVQEGLEEGIERYGKILMPALFVLLILLVVRSLSLEGSWEGVSYYLTPNFSQITPKICFYALGQAFFSLCIGEAVLITYGSYANKKDNLVASASYIAFFDTLIAFLAGLIIFPALFALGFSGDLGVGLTFEIIPELFARIPFGNIFAAGFFLMLGFAAFTTCVALLEMPVAFLIETTPLSRKEAAWIMGSIAFLFGLPSAFSYGANSWLTELQIPFVQERGFYEIMDFFWGNLGMVISGFLLALFTGWVWSWKEAADELKKGCPSFTWQSKIWGWIIKWAAPIIIFGIFLQQVYLSQ